MFVESYLKLPQVWNFSDKDQNTLTKEVCSIYCLYIELYNVLCCTGGQSCQVIGLLWVLQFSESSSVDKSAIVHVGLQGSTELCQPL